MLPAFRAMGAEKVTKRSNGSEDAAEKTVRDRGLVRKKRSKNQGNDNAAQHDGGKIIVHLRLLFTVHRLGIMTEEEHDDRNRCKRAKLHGEEDTGASVHPEEMGEVHLRIGAEHDGGGITDQSGGTLQIGRNGDRKEHRNRIDLQLFADGKPDGSNHQDRCHIVNKCRDSAGEEGHENSDPHDIAGFVQKKIGNPVRHL